MRPRTTSRADASMKPPLASRWSRLIFMRDYPLVHLLIRTKWFRRFFFLMLLLMWSIPICLIKVWPTTPEGFEPSIKVSLLDKLQSWALHRAAVDHAAKKEMEASLHAWHASMINDPGNIDVMGEYFDFLLEQDLQRLAVVDAARSGLW
jgi:hypothetical protein